MSSIKVRKYNDSVYVINTHKNQKFKIFTGVKIPDEFWNSNNPKKKYSDYKNAITQITSIEARILNACTAVRT